MKKYTNSIGLVCIEAEEGYLLKRNGQTFKKAMLGKNDRPELYEEIADESYVFKDENQDQNHTGNNYILTSPNGRKFKIVVSDNGILDVEEI